MHDRDETDEHFLLRCHHFANINSKVTFKRVLVLTFCLFFNKSLHRMSVREMALPAGVLQNNKVKTKHGVL